MFSFTRRLGAALGAGAAFLAATPAAAFAEEERSGIELLIPALAELIPAIVAFAIIFAVMSKLVWPRVVEMMDEREKRLADAMSDADAAKQRLAEADEAYRARMADAEREATELISTARREAEEERSAILGKAQKDAAATLAKARDAIESERKRAMVELSRSVVDLSVEIAGKIVGESLDDDQHRAMAERYLEEVGGDAEE